MINAVQNYNNVSKINNYKQQSAPNFGSNFELKLGEVKPKLVSLSTMGGSVGDFLDTLSQDFPALIRKIVKNDGLSDDISYAVKDIDITNKRPVISGDLFVTRNGKQVQAKDVKVPFIPNANADVAPHGYAPYPDSLITKVNELDEIA